MMYRFILNCWKMNKITEADIQAFAGKGYITGEEAAEIMAVPKEG